MDQAHVQAALAHLPFNEVAFFASIGSTNDLAVAWARVAVPPPALVAADEQTAGRGRSGRGWLTPPGSALAFSLLLSPPEVLARGRLGLVSGLGALAVAQALEGLGLQPEIKWPNDVLLECKKTSGILAEAHWQGEHLSALVMGIGINVALASVPPMAELGFPATCVETALGRTVDRLELLVAVAGAALDWLPRMGGPDFLAAWEQRLAYRGQAVRLEREPDGSQEGELLGLAADGSLRLRGPDGEIHDYPAGEIRLRPLVDSAAK